MRYFLTWEKPLSRICLSELHLREEKIKDFQLELGWKKAGCGYYMMVRELDYEIFFLKAISR